MPESNCAGCGLQKPAHGSIEMRIGEHSQKAFLCFDCVEKFRRNTALRLMLETKLSPEWRKLIYG
jgi:hypothetical protein